MNPTVRFTMDEAYFRAFHAEMVATRLTGWRRQRQVGVVLALVGCVGTVLSAAWLRPEAGVIAVLTAAFGFWALKRLQKRRERWLLYQRSLPIFGAQVEVELDGWQLVQRADRIHDVTAIATGEIRESPRGWFVTYGGVALGTPTSDGAVSTERASAWFPHAFEPPIDRDAFAAALDETFTVQRR